MMNKQTLLDYLTTLDACQEAQNYVREHQSEEAREIWSSCSRLRKEGIVRKLISLDPLRAEYIVKGDSKVWAIGAASIIAKVWRDAYMADESASYPCYGWENNAGYGTPGHTNAIRVNGLSPLHMATFCRSFTKPIRATESEPASDIISDLFG